MITLTDTPPPRSRSSSTPRASPSWRCASPCVPVAAPASPTRCSSTPTSPPTTSRPTTAACKVVVDPSSAQLLTGATLDYKDGLQQAGFSINNPNASRTCGCGNSFS